MTVAIRKAEQRQSPVGDFEASSRGMTIAVRAFMSVLEVRRVMRLATVIGTVVWVLALLPRESTAAASEAVAFTHVNVVDATGATERTDQTVVINGERIAAVGPANEVRVPAGARVVEARGKYLIPGLWDLHVHVQREPEVLPVFVANGVLGIRELSAPMPEIERIRAAGRAGTLVMPRISASGQMIEAGPVRDVIEKIASPEMAEPILRNRYFVDTPAQAREAVQKAASAHPDWIKHHVNLKRDVYFAVLDEARRVGIPVAGHYPMGEKISLRELADAGQRTIEHLKNNTAPEFIALSDEERRSIVAYVRDHGVAFVPTLVASMADDKYAEEPTAAARIARARRDSRARYVSPATWKSWQDALAANEALAQPKEKLAVDIPKSDLQAELRLLREMHQGGVPVLAATDFAVQFLFPGSSLHEELIELVKQLGMTPAEALQSATRRPAELMGLQESLGTVQPGKIADLVLLDANPLTDIANTQKIRAVMQAGKLYDRQALDELLDQTAARIQEHTPARETAASRAAH